MPTDDRLVWSRPARQDLREIWRHAAADVGPDRADAFIRRIEASCRRLIVTPLMGRSREELRPGIRSIAVHPHVVFYTVHLTSVEVVRVLHGRRDLPSLFGAEIPEAK